MEKQELNELADQLGSGLPIVVDAGKPEEPKPEEPKADEPKTRLTFKQTHQLVSYCGQIPEQSHETWVAMAEAATEKLGFKVTRYSLKMALEAAGRNPEAFLKPSVVAEEFSEAAFSSLRKRIASLEQVHAINLEYASRISNLEMRVKTLEDKYGEPEVF